MSKPKGACTHEPVMSSTDSAVPEFIEREMRRAGSVSLKAIPFGGVNWHCAKCKRWLKARWYPAEAPHDR